MSNDKFDNLPLGKFLDKIKKIADDKMYVDKKNKLNRYYEALCVEFLKDDKKDIRKNLSDILNTDEKPKALFFGAGISMDKPFELPAWNRLLQRAVVGELFKEYEIPDEIEYDKFLRILLSHDDESDNYFNSFDLYELGQFLEDERRRANNSDGSGIRRDVAERERLTDSEMFEIVKKCLCLNYNEQNSCWELTDGRYRLKRKTATTPFINNLRDFAIEKGIKRIVTYNYDNAFEYTFSDEYNIVQRQEKLEKQIQSVFLEEQFVGLDESKVLPIYHVHGYIPIYNSKDNDKISQKPYNECIKGQEYPEIKKLILSEESYDAIEHSSYKWRNVVQIDTFLRYNCIFFGFSATDKNFKRIVKLMDRYSLKKNSINNSEVKHYIFLNIDDYIANIFGASVDKIIKCNNDNILLYPALNKKHVRFSVFSLAEYLSTLCSRLEDALKKNTDANVDKTVLSNILKNANAYKERLFIYVNEINENTEVLAYSPEEDIDNAEFQDYGKLENLTTLFKNIDELIKNIKVNYADKIINIKNLCNKIEERLDGLVSNVDILIARLQCLHFTLRTKRKYLKKMNIYPIWTTIKGLNEYLEFVLTA